MSSSDDFAAFHILFSQASNKPKWTSTKYSLEQKASCFEISPDGCSVSIGDANGQLVTLRILDGALMVSDDCERHQSRITDIAFNPTADLIATCSNENTIELSSFEAHSSKTGNRRIRMTMSDSVRALTFMEDLANRSNILFCGVGRQICITDCSSGTTFRVLKGHNGVITSFCTWGGCMFASSSTDKTIRIWDMRVSDAVRVFDPLPKPAAKSAFHVDGNGRILIRGDASGTVHAFDTSSSKKLCSRRISAKPILCLRIANARRFVTVADENRISLCDFRDVFQVPEPSCITKCASKCIAVRWHPTQPSFATLDNENALNLWQLEKEDTFTDGAQSSCTDLSSA